MAELKVQQDALRDTITINGIVYSRAVFEDFAAAMPLGRVFRLVSRENKVLTIEYLPDGVTASALTHNPALREELAKQAHAAAGDGTRWADLEPSQRDQWRIKATAGVAVGQAPDRRSSFQRECDEIAETFRTAPVYGAPGAPASPPLSREPATMRHIHDEESDLTRRRAGAGLAAPDFFDGWRTAERFHGITTPGVKGPGHG